nr:YopX family protein [Cyanobacteria bacterium RUI128]
YEGDICEYEFEDIGKQKAIIYFNNKYASFLTKPLNDFQYAEINDCKVIGNIYENADLLEDTENE